MAFQVESPPSVLKWRAETARLFFVSPARARRAAAKARLAAGRLPAGPVRQAGRALAFEAAALAEHAHGRYRSAVSLYRKSVGILDALGLRREAARLRKNLVDALQYLHRLDEARREGARACRAFQKLGDRAGLAHALVNLGNLAQRRDRPAEAVRFYARARTFFNRLRDPANLALVALNESVARTSLDDFRRALVLLEEARRQGRLAGRDLLVAQADFDESWVRVMLGDFRAALDRLERAREAFTAVRDEVKTAVLDLDRAEILLLLNRFAESAEAAGVALAVLRREGMTLEAGRALILAGEAEGELGRADRAARLLAAAARSYGRAGRKAGAARAALALARLERNRGRTRNAERLAGQAARSFGALKLRSPLAAALLLRADALLALGRDAHARRVLDGVPRGPALPVEMRARFHHLSAKLHLSRGRPAAAYRSIKKAVELTERIRASVPGSGMRAGWLEDKAAVYEEAAELALARRVDGASERAFFHTEQARARSLLDRIATEPRRTRTERGRRLLERYRDVRDAARWLSGRLLAGDEIARPVHAARLARSLRAKEATLAALLPRLEASAEDASLTLPRPAAGADIRAELEEDQALVAFLVRPDHSFAFVLTRDGLEAVPLSAGGTFLAEEAARLRFHWDRFLLGQALARHAGQMKDGVERSLARLGDSLIAPLGTRLAGRRLVLVPSGPLHDIPFAALPVGGPPAAAAGSSAAQLSPAGNLSASGSAAASPFPRRLVDDHEIVFAPSGAAWAGLRRRARRRVSRPGGAPLVMGLAASQLTWAPVECDAVAAVLPGAVKLVGPEATLEAFRRHAAAAPFLHLATHGLFNEADPLLSSVRLADASLNLHELADLDLSARLAVLSGCQTGLGRLSPGEELAGLSRGFLQAGAEAVVASLWLVDDPATAKLMGRLWERMAAGESPAAALRAAMLFLRESHPHPYHWAPFVLTGSA